MIEKIRQDLKDAMRNKDTLKITTLRTFLADLKKAAIDSCKREDGLTEQEIITVLNHSIKIRKEAIEEFTKVQRADRAEGEKKELEILQSYLPKQLSEEDLDKAVEEAIKEAGATSKKDIGKVMKALIQKYQGQFNAKKANEIAGKKLS